MKGIEKIRNMLTGLPEGCISLEDSESFQREITRIERKYSQLQKRYEFTLKERAIIHSLLQKTSADLIRQYRTIFENSAVPMIILSQEGTISLVNSHFYTLTGYSKEETRNMNGFDLISESFHEMMKNAGIPNEESRNGPLELETHLITKQGIIRDVVLSIGFFEENTTSIISIIDVTERNRIRSELRKHGNRLEGLLHLYEMTGEPDYAITDYAIRKAIELTGSRFGFLVSITGEEDLVSIEGIGSEPGKNGIILSKMTYSLSELPLIRQVAVSGEILILNMPLHAGKIFSELTTGPESFARVMLIPVMEAGKMLGVAGVCNKDTEYDNSDELQLKVLMSGLLRIMMRNRQHEALQVAHKKLSLLSSLTRHDILNLITSLKGYLDLSGDMIKEPQVRAFISKAVNAADGITGILDFTKDYEQVGINSPIWQDISRIFEEAALPLSGLSLSAIHRVDSIWIYADPLLIRVFSNFIDNSLRHGKEISTINFTSEERGDTLVLIYEDDGVGVTEQEKERIFMRGYGKHTGLGLFLIREILSITNITIREIGIPEKGVRFEMEVPRGNYRILTPTAAPLMNQAQGGELPK